MFLEKLQTYIEGYILFKAEGGFPERFINLCSNNNVDIQDVKMSGNTITASCAIKSYRKIRQISRKSGMKVRLVSKHGLPFWLNKKRKHIGIVFGFVFLMIFTFLLSGRIWVIDVKGNETVPDEKIISDFSRLGVKEGIKKDSLNVKEIARDALIEVDNLMWCAVNVDGCRITIEIKEQHKKEIEEENEEAYGNIVAKHPGQIIKIENFLGTPVMETGSAVEKGDVIISGAVVNKNESVSFYKAEANVYARTKNELSHSLGSKQNMRIYKRARKKYFLTFFSVTLPINFTRIPKGNNTFSWGEDFLISSSGKLPVGIRTERYAPYEKKKILLTEPAERLMCAEEFFRKYDERFCKAEIEKSEFEIVKDKNSLSVISLIECTENIAESKPMEITIEKHNE